MMSVKKAQATAMMRTLAALGAISVPVIFDDKKLEVTRTFMLIAAK